MEVDNSEKNINESDVEDIKLRDMQCELNMLSRPDGSAIYSQGNTVVLTAIYGPVDNKLQNSDIFTANVEVSFSTKSGLPTVRERLRETILKQICDSAIIISLHPRTTISVSIQEMQDFGGLLACSINACCLALLNSGLSMQYLFAAVNCAIAHDGTVLLDPSAKESEDVMAQLTFTFDSISNHVISCSSNGKFSLSQYKDCLSKCQRASRKIFKYYRDIVQKYAKTI